MASRAAFFASRTLYRAPLRCGLLLVEATPTVGRWLVSKILGWDDITDDQGRVLVSNWNNDRQRIEKTWVTQ